MQVSNTQCSDWSNIELHVSLYHTPRRLPPTCQVKGNYRLILTVVFTMRWLSFSSVMKMNVIKLPVFRDRFHTIIITHWEGEFFFIVNWAPVTTFNEEFPRHLAKSNFSDGILQLRLTSETSRVNFVKSANSRHGFDSKTTRLLNYSAHCMLSVPPKEGSNEGPDYRGLRIGT